MSTHTHDTQKTIVDLDGYLEPFRGAITHRRDSFLHQLDDIAKRYGSLNKFASWNEEMGFHWKGNDFVYREWAPEADQLYLVGDFNNWEGNAHALTKKDHGVWELVCNKKEVPHGSEVKVRVESRIGTHDRLPTFITYTKQNPTDHSYNGVVWNPPKKFEWKDKNFVPKARPLLIYEAHVGMAVEEHRVGNYREFADNILPYIADVGYTCVQFMAIMEHPYYGSFGYHVSNLYATSSRFGSPDDFKYLVNKAHEMGIIVIMDVIHSHAVKNFNEGLHQFDGSNYQFFHEGTRGFHTLWDSKLYNYNKEEVQRYLLSNLKFWLEEYHVDGFRFDGITSMLYLHHGHYKDFTHYSMYFDQEVDTEALLYLQLANEVCHDVKPNSITIAEDMSGMPGLGRSQREGGVGFDYRLAMGVPDNWIKILKECADEDWDLSAIYHMMTDRRYGEKSISYCESHDQALVGDKTLAFQLMDQEMYWNMNIDSRSHIIDRGIALHKLIRFLTMLLGGEGYLTFMGNEFGHPEWIDFPREGNDFSYQYARRQWSLKDNASLRYAHLLEFEKKCLLFIKSSNIIEEDTEACSPKLISIDVANKIIVFELRGFVFIFSFNAENSISDYQFGVPQGGTYKLVLCSDDADFGGFSRVDRSFDYHAEEVSAHGKSHSLRVYIPNRTALVLERV